MIFLLSPTHGNTKCQLFTFSFGLHPQTLDTLLAHFVRGPWIVLITKFCFKICKICLFDKCTDVRPLTWNGVTTTNIAKVVRIV